MMSQRGKGASLLAPGGAGVTRFATRDEHRLSYESSGEATAGPVLALHDLLGDRGQLRPLAAALAGSGFRVTLPDARGHGASAMISGASYPPRALAADALAVLDAEGLPTADIVAVGWSAATALAIAATAPERVRALVLIAPAVPALLGDHPRAEARQYGAALQETAAEAADAALRGQTDRALDLYLGIRWGAGWRERLTRPRLGAIRRAAASLGPHLAGMAPGQVDRAAWRRIDRPLTLLLRHDAPAFERWNAEALAMLIPGAGVQTVIIPAIEEGHAALAPEWAPILARVLAARGS